MNPCTHRLANLNVIEIKEKGIEMLKPSSSFVESLHEWLLFGPLSSAFDHDFYPLHTGIYNAQLQKIVWWYPIPSHFISDPRKQTYSPTFEFLFRMRGILTRVIKNKFVRFDILTNWFHAFVISPLIMSQPKFIYIWICCSRHFTLHRWISWYHIIVPQIIFIYFHLFVFNLHNDNDKSNNRYSL